MPGCGAVCVGAWPALLPPGESVQPPRDRYPIGSATLFEFGQDHGFLLRGPVRSEQGYPMVAAQLVRFAFDTFAGSANLVGYAGHGLRWSGQRCDQLLGSSSA